MPPSRVGVIPVVFMRSLTLRHHIPLSRHLVPVVVLSVTCIASRPVLSLCLFLLFDPFCSAHWDFGCVTLR
ncbi:hypothetical protein DICSQDRAFT_146972 [Dichomitus squalens LYAD-421 SS1]|uniref:Uncharacterized protein n=1 Tax=Dichomitus squalens (strain LYAD-421) TaxID=732165 RepID=R7T0H1_DICSQ|nr:uncharacterized protein DICSQDRAFT_146972 [Dichomitus squalens LYAD-421 SS1]EJF61851.1 hypothetical protein DICSQDRAFT_146972 [Dichomitus squalens LYAD-421 SS1]